MNFIYRPVKVVRLISRDTVEEIVLKRAEGKLKLTNTVIEGGQVITLCPEPLSYSKYFVGFKLELMKKCFIKKCCEGILFLSKNIIGFLFLFVMFCFCM